jgi:hypothetical protein
MAGTGIKDSIAGFGSSPRIQVPVEPPSRIQWTVSLLIPSCRARSLLLTPRFQVA